MKDNFKEKIFSKIEKEEIEPIPESYFENKYRIIWILIGIIILFGILFSGFLLDNSSEFLGMRGYTGGNINYFIFPHIFWLVLILFLIFIGIISLRNTAIGYRRSYIQDIVIGIIIIFIGGYLLRFTGFGPIMHGFFINNVPGISNILYNESSWNDPNNGRLAGTILSISDDTITLKSIDGSVWNIEAENSFISPMISLGKNEKIRVLGVKISTGTFESERIMPWFGMGMGGGRGWNGFGNGKGMMR